MQPQSEGDVWGAPQPGVVWPPLSSGQVLPVAPPLALAPGWDHQIHPAFATNFPFNMLLKPQGTQWMGDPDPEFPIGGLQSRPGEKNSQVVQVLKKKDDEGKGDSRVQSLQGGISEMVREVGHDSDATETDEPKPVMDAQPKLADALLNAASSPPEDMASKRLNAADWAPVPILDDALEAPLPGVSTKDKLRVPLACKTCSRMKMRCDELRPCTRCMRADRKCEDRDPMQAVRALKRKKQLSDLPSRNIENDDGDHASLPPPWELERMPSTFRSHTALPRSAQDESGGRGPRAQSIPLNLVQSGEPGGLRLAPTLSEQERASAGESPLPHEVTLVQFLRHAQHGVAATGVDAWTPAPLARTDALAALGAEEDDALITAWEPGAGGGVRAGLDMLHAQWPGEEVQVAGWGGMAVLQAQAQQHWEAARQLALLQAQRPGGSGALAVGAGGGERQLVRAASVCEHKKERGRCQECEGAALCAHKKPRQQCRECAAPAVCEHGRKRAGCEECQRASICEHDRPMRECKVCWAAAICEHNRPRGRCSKCGGASSLCEHNKHRYRCKDCGGSSICEHNRHRYRCKDCGGSSICEHKKHRYRCAQCKGSAICKHNKHKYRCKECRSTPATATATAPSAASQQPVKEEGDTGKPARAGEESGGVGAEAGEKRTAGGGAGETEEVAQTKAARAERVRAVLTTALVRLGWDTRRPAGGGSKAARHAGRQPAAQTNRATPQQSPKSKRTPSPRG